MVSVNYVAVLVVAIINMILGTLWYGPLFGKQWIKMMGWSQEHMDAAKKKGMGASYAIMFVGSLLMAWVLAVFIGSAEMHYQIWTASYGVHIALYLWLGIVVPVTISSVAFEGKKWPLWFLNVGYYLVGMCIMGAILAVWM